MNQTPTASAMDQSLDRLFTAMDVTPHALSVCRIQSGWRMTFPLFKVITIHFVLQGTGHLKAGDAEPIAFVPSSVLIVPALQSHWVGDARPAANVAPAAERCALIGDGLVEFTAGNGAEDTLLLCAAVSAPYDAALGLFDLLRRPITAAVNHPRLARALAAIIERPGADHSVDSLASLAGVSRASFTTFLTRFCSCPTPLIPRPVASLPMCRPFPMARPTQSRASASR